MVDPNVFPLARPERCLLLDAAAPGRAAAERFVRQTYEERFGARISLFPPTLFALCGADGRMLAVAGLRAAASERLFLEAYLDEPIERALGRRTLAPIARARIVEVGSLATRAPGYARILIQSLTAFLCYRHYEWVAFTAVSTLRNSFRRLGLNPLVLCAADPARLADAGGAWGSYYQHAPLVMYGNLGEGCRRLQGLAPSDPAVSIAAAAVMGRGPT